MLQNYDVAPEMSTHILKGAGDSEVTIYYHGSHVTSWKNNAGREMIYTSPKAIFNGEKAIRGGIPICFPQFGKHGPLPQHGFARNLPWSRDESFVAPAGEDAVRFVLTDTEVTRASEWPHRFKAVYTISLSEDGNSLNVLLQVTNCNTNQPFTFTTALHSYFTCDAESTTLHDFEGVTYGDSIDPEEPGRTKVQSGTIEFGKEVDRVYKSTSDTLTIPQAALTMTKTNLPEAVVWNPYKDKAAALSDMPDDGWKNFICIEPARIEQCAEVLSGETWSCEFKMTSDS